VRPRHLILAATIAAVAAGCGATEGAGGAESLADLTVRVDRDGPRGPGKTHEQRVRCEAAADGGACAAAARLEPEDFAPVPPNRACTQLFGGPETARVFGRLRGVTVSGSFSRTNGCEIARWDVMSALLERVP
jgi:hypothetical protein